MNSDRPNADGRRVVITGAGLLSPAGNTLESYWQGLTCGESAIREVTLFDTGDMPTRVGGEVDQDALKAEVKATTLERTDRTVLLGIVAAGRALEDAGIPGETAAGTPVGVLVGSGLGPCFHAEEGYAAFTRRGWVGVRPATIPRLMYNVVASQITIRYGLTGGHHVVAAACTSGSLAQAEAFRAIRDGAEDVVLTGGCDSPMTPSIYGAWMNLKVLSKNPDPRRACRPFDRQRDGMVLGEGAAMFVFEEAGRALARGARVYGEVIGCGASSDATHVTRPSAEGQALAVRRALDSAGIAPEDVDYVNAHGTATMVNDPTETEAMQRALGDEARRIPISATKSVIGHPIGASGALETAAVLLAMQHQTLPPTVNLDDPDPACDLDYVPNVPRPAPVRIALNNSFGFGGANCVLVIRDFKEEPHG